MRKTSASAILALMASFTTVSYAIGNNGDISFTQPQKSQAPIGEINTQQLTVDELLNNTSNKGIPTNKGVDILSKPIVPELSAIAISSEPYAQQIADLVNRFITTIPWQGLNNRLRSPEAVSKLYQQVGFRPLWSQNGYVTPLAEQMIQAISDAKYHALNPVAYHQNAISAFKAGQEISEPAKFDLLLTDAFITYQSHLKNGILSPKSQFSTWNTPPQAINYLENYEKSAAQGSLEDLFVVHDEDYLILQKAYKKSLENTDKVTHQPNLPYLKGKKSGPEVKALRARLGLDTSIDKYDAELIQAVKDYQANHGLGADGIAGGKTINHMNRRNTSKIDPEKLAINMERLRWSYVPHNQNYIWVNIPAYHMTVKNNNKTVFSSRAIVGRSKRPTPVFSDRLKHVVLAPYWNVPSTIFKEDKLPKLRKNPNAFAGNLEVLSTSTGKVVNPANVNWSNGGKGYRLRQKPGPRNALGRMKFLFPNRHAIYLHDTPNRKLFKRSKRALSSGCIRVQRAEDLATFLLKDMGYNRARVKKESRRSKEKWVNLSRQLRYPVFLNYYTVWVDDDGKLRNAADIYGYDRKMKRAYRNKLKNL